MPKGFCPDCGSSIGLGKEVWKGKQVKCYRCDALLVVQRESPIELDLSYGTEAKPNPERNPSRRVDPDRFS